MAEHTDLNHTTSGQTPPVPQAEAPAPNHDPLPSRFHGTTLQLIGWRLLGILLSVLTLGIGAPWAHCMIYRWEISHSSVDGQRLSFDGKGHQLLGKYLLWGLLTVITLGIYVIWIPVRMHKWKASHTRIAAPDETPKSLSAPVILGVVLGTIAVAVLLFMGCRPLLAKLPKELPETDLEGISESVQEWIAHLFVDQEELPTAPTIPFGQEGTFIIDNGDGTFTVIYGTPPDGTAATGNGWEQEQPTHSQSAYSFTDDPRIIGGWLFRAILRGGTELEAGELQLADDGTFTYFKDLFSGGGSDWGWRPDGIGESRSRGAYTFYDGVLTLYYGEYFYEMYSSEPGEWVATDATVTQQITFAETGDAIYFSSISDVFTHNGYFDPIEYCPRITGSIGDMLDAIYPNGIQ